MIEIETINQNEMRRGEDRRQKGRKKKTWQDQHLPTVHHLLPISQKQSYSKARSSPQSSHAPPKTSSSYIHIPNTSSQPPPPSSRLHSHLPFPHLPLSFYSRSSLLLPSPQWNTSHRSNDHSFGSGGDDGPNWKIYGKVGIGWRLHLVPILWKRKKDTGWEEGRKRERRGPTSIEGPQNRRIALNWSCNQTQARKNLGLLQNALPPRMRRHEWGQRKHRGCVGNVFFFKRFVPIYRTDFCCPSNLVHQKGPNFFSSFLEGLFSQHLPPPNQRFRCSKREAHFICRYCKKFTITTIKSFLLLPSLKLYYYYYYWGEPWDLSWVLEGNLGGSWGRSTFTSLQQEQDRKQGCWKHGSIEQQNRSRSSWVLQPSQPSLQLSWALPSWALPSWALQPPSSWGLHQPAWQFEQDRKQEH